MKFNKYWFKPKGFGYGATPTTWEGWLLVLGFIVYLLSLSLLLKDGKIGTYLLYFLIGIVGIFVISKKKTDGEWKWNWGKKKDVEGDQNGMQKRN